MKYYAGIGSRKTPELICHLMMKLANQLGQKWYVLRSGGAEGADKAFEQGAWGWTTSVILRPKDATDEAIKLAGQYHPAWGMCNPYVRKLLGRNVQIILGQDLTQPVDFVLFWTRDERRGGTAHAIKIARAHNIPVFNLRRDEKLEAFYKEYLNGEM